uniref:Nuclear VCP like n=1 Tax=Scleropages formosus TaxID=113540 RepID=A0A8C9VEH4_SCLFO
ESGIVGLENKHLAKRFTNHMNNSLMSLYRKGAPESGTPQREKPTGGSVANSTAVSATKVSSGGWFIDKGRGAEDDNILIDLCEEDAGSPVKQTDVSMLEAEKKPKKNRVKRGKRRKEGELLVADGVIESSVKDAKALPFCYYLCCLTILPQEVCKLLIHMRHPEVYQQLGVVPPRGFLLHGPPGCGKTLLAHAVAGEMALPLLKVSAPELVSGVSGESEQKLRELFEQAVTNAPCILFIDEIDAITPKREVASKDMERRIVAQLLTCMDDLNSLAVTAQVLVIGATNRPDSLDPALRRAGRFDREVCLGIPDEGARLRILKTLCRKLTLPTDFDFQLLARLTPGYVGADLMALCREAAMNAVNRALFQLKQKDLQVNTSEPLTQNGLLSPAQDELCSLLSLLKSDTALSGEQLSNLCILMSDFQESLSCVQPSAKREGFATVPDVTWADIGALQDIREELTMAILAPVRSPEQFKALGLTAPAGVLLAGPPGCGKTLLAKAVANESGLNFISVKGPELLNMYVGESERAVRQIDALCPRRSGHESGASVRVVNQLLTEMDGLETRRQVFIMAATNRPDIIDPAVLRPGRLDKTLYVGLPLPSDRHAILLTVTKGGMRPPLEADVNLEEIAYDERCDCFTRQNFEDAFKKVRPSVSKKVS